MKTRITFYIVFHTFLAFLPFIVGTIKTDWYIAPILVLNGMVQGAIIVYKIKSNPQ